MCSHRAVLGCTKLIPFAYRLQMYGRCAFSGSLSFVSALWGVLLPHIYTGGTIRMLGKLDIDTWFRAMEEDKSTFTYVPTPLMPAFAAETNQLPQGVFS